MQTTRPARFIIYYDGEPCRIHPNRHLNGRKRYQYSSEKLAQKYLNELVESLKWSASHEHYCGTSKKILNSLDYNKFEIVEFGEIRRIKPMWGGQNAT